jgi:hypothetical protein
MEELVKNGSAFLQSMFPKSIVMHLNGNIKDPNTTLRFKLVAMIALDTISGIKQRQILVESVNSKTQLDDLASNIDKIFEGVVAGLEFTFDNPVTQSKSILKSDEMTFAPRVLLYTKKCKIPNQKIVQIFDNYNILIEIINESKMHKTLFISYGGTDEQQATEINKLIKAKGVKTWFFPDDAVPGDKLHRMMYDGINKYERVLLICSKESLSRPGVLNEIERVLEREAKEGGSDILIPITLDGYVYGDWAPTRMDIANQIKLRVITKIDFSKKINPSIEKIVKALKK